jgi:hypothetical protein
VWLYCGNDEADDSMVHTNGGDLSDPSGLVRSLGERAEDALVGGGAADHIAFAATGLPDRYRPLNVAEIPWRERPLPCLGLHQVFIEDLSRLTTEPNFPPPKWLLLAVCANPASIAKNLNLALLREPQILPRPAGSGQPAHVSD